MTIPTSHRLWRLAAPCALLLLAAPPAFAADWLGSAGAFAVLGASAVTNAGATTVHGDLGVYGGSSITDAGALTVSGATHQTDGVAQQAQTDAALGYAALALLAPATDLSGFDLGTLGPLTPGVYSFGSSAQLTGALVLDFGSDPGGAFVFQIGTALTTASGSTVSVLNGGAGSGVFWQVGSSATLGTGSAFAGNILAGQSITLNTGASLLCGRAIALVGAVTLQGAAISTDCRGDGALGSGRSDFASQGFAGLAQSDPSAAPEPAAWALMLAGFGLAGSALRRRRAAGAAAA